MALPPAAHSGCQKIGRPYTRKAWAPWSICSNLTSPCLVFSIGIGREWWFDEFMADRGCEVHSFDPTIDLHDEHARVAHQLRNRGGGIHFHYVGLGAPSATNYSGMYTQRKQSSLSEVAHLDVLLSRFAPGRRINVLKIDCEGCEWKEFAYLASRQPRLLERVDELQLELHLTPSLHGLSGAAAARLVPRFFQHVMLEHGFRLHYALMPHFKPESEPVLPGEGVVPKELTAVAGTVATIGTSERPTLNRDACCYGVVLRRVSAAAAVEAEDLA